MQTRNKTRYTHAAIAAAVLAVTAGAYAATNATGGAENDAMAINNAKVSMTQAVAAAEQHTSGKAVKAEYENTKAGWAWDVEVVNGAKVFDVRVDAANGTVLSSNEDKRDHDDDRDERD